MSKLEKRFLSKPKGVCLMCKTYVTIASIGGVDVLRSFQIGACVNQHSTHYQHNISQLHPACDVFDRREVQEKTQGDSSVKKDAQV